MVIGFYLAKMMDTPTNSWIAEQSLEGSLWQKLPDSSRLWVYVADRLLSPEENERVGAIHGCVGGSRGRFNSELEVTRFAGCFDRFG